MKHRHEMRKELKIGKLTMGGITSIHSADICFPLSQVFVQYLNDQCIVCDRQERVILDEYIALNTYCNAFMIHVIQPQLNQIMSPIPITLLLSISTDYYNPQRKFSCDNIFFRK